MKNPAVTHHIHYQSNSMALGMPAGKIYLMTVVRHENADRLLSEKTEGTVIGAYNDCHEMTIISDAEPHHAEVSEQQSVQGINNDLIVSPVIPLAPTLTCLDPRKQSRCPESFWH